MGNSNAKPLSDQIFDIKFSAKQLNRQAAKAEKDYNKARAKIKTALQEGNPDIARVYGETAIRQNAHRLNLMRMAARLDGVASKLQNVLVQKKVSQDMTRVTKALHFTMKGLDLEKTGITMDKFEQRLEDLDVQMKAVEDTIGNTVQQPVGQVTEVDELMMQIAEANGLEMASSLTDIGIGNKSLAREEKQQVQEEEDPLAARLRALNA
jgi:charged multivesicular body protein 1